jgi:hypothetical protein
LRQVLDLDAGLLRQAEELIERAGLILNLARLLTEAISAQPEPKRTELARILERFQATGAEDLELMGREGNEILFRVGTTVFHLPIVELTKSIEGDEGTN